MQGIIEIDPKQFLDFEAEENKLAHTQLILQNLTNQEISFKIKTTVPNLFQVKPSVGVIAPTQAINIEISTTQPIKPDLKFDAKFQINACIKDSQEADLGMFWRNRDQSTVQQVQLRSRVKQAAAPPEMFQPDKSASQHDNQDSKMFQSSIQNSGYSDQKLFKSVVETDTQKDEQLKSYKDKLEKLEAEMQIMKKKAEVNQKSPIQTEKSMLTLQQALVIVIVALVVGYLVGR